MSLTRQKGNVGGELIPFANTAVPTGADAKVTNAVNAAGPVLHGELITGPEYRPHGTHEQPCTSLLNAALSSSSLMHSLGGGKLSLASPAGLSALHTTQAMAYSRAST